MAPQNVSPTTGRRKRPPVPENSRKRVARACEPCRHVKERCEGGVPCSRCKRLNRHCGIDLKSNRDSQEGGAPQTSDFLHVERIKMLESIVSQYTGVTEFDLGTLRKLSQPSPHTTSPGVNTVVSDSSRFSPMGQSGYIAIPAIMATPSGDLSHCSFLDRLQCKIDEGLNNPSQQILPSIMNDKRPLRVARLASKDPQLANAAASILPPVAVCQFLADVFFGFAQTNYSYVDETSFRLKFDSIYKNTGSITVEDSPSICLILMVLAIGSQMAHLSSRQQSQKFSGSREAIPDDIVVPDDDVALTLYRAATTLISDCIIIASVESVQCFLLFGVYTLPIDAAGLSYSYFGIGVKMAVENGLHRKSSLELDAILVERRNRIWWSIYTLERRISVLHGMPVTLAGSEVNALLPTDMPELRVEHRIVTMANVLAMIKLTSFLEEGRDKITSLRHAQGDLQVTIFSSILQLKQNLSDYWLSLPSSMSATAGPLFRVNAHLALTYHLIFIFMGRTFIFSPHPPSGESPSWSKVREVLVSGCVQSALAIVNLCQLLQDEIGLARASYTEFTSCRSALLVILARRIQADNPELVEASERGMRLINFMSVGLYSAAAEKAGIKAMGAAVQRLNRKVTDYIVQGSARESSAYNQFQHWAKLWKSNVERSSSSPSSNGCSINGTASVSHPIPSVEDSVVPTPFGDDFNSLFSSFPFEINEFASFSGLNQDFDFNMDPREE